MPKKIVKGKMVAKTTPDQSVPSSIVDHTIYDLKKRVVKLENQERVTKTAFSVPFQTNTFWRGTALPVNVDNFYPSSTFLDNSAIVDIASIGDYSLVNLQKFQLDLYIGYSPIALPELPVATIPDFSLPVKIGVAAFDPATQYGSILEVTKMWLMIDAGEIAFVNGGAGGSATWLYSNFFKSINLLDVITQRNSVDIFGIDYNDMREDPERIDTSQLNELINNRTKLYVFAVIDDTNASSDQQTRLAEYAASNVWNITAMLRYIATMPSGSLSNG